ncbi:CAR1 transcription factor [Bactrocera oleae]|uniref:CAR1 transcription factor n=1 Tax=Bactrocera oleae TaxID=104688 RepID=UPI00387E6F87
MFQDYENLPPNHAPTYSDVSVNPFLIATGVEMDKYANAEDRARYPNQMTYPMPPEMGEMGDATNLHGLYPSGGGVGTGWGDDPTGTGGGTGQSGYGYGPPYGAGAGGYDYHPAAPVHVPTGGSYSHHATAGSGYGGYAPPPPKIYARPHPTVPTKGFKKKHSTSDSNASTMNALTLLAFFFFVNLLQSCLKENMEAMNPTVMVMTTNMVRNRNTKLAEMNSREQSSSPASAFTSGANIVVQPETLVSAGSSSVAAGAPGLASVTLQTSPYSHAGGGGGGASAGVSSAVNVGNNFAGGTGVTSSNNHINNYNNNNYGGINNGNHRPAEPQYSYGTNGLNSGQQNLAGAAVIQNQHNQNVNSNNNNQAYGANHQGDTYPFSPTPTIITANRDPRPEFYDPTHLYRNQTINSATSINQQQHYQQHQQHHQQRPYPPEQFEEEEYEAQAPQQQPPSQIQRPQQQEHLAHNQFQQQQHYHENRPNDNNAQQQQTVHHEDYHEHDHNQQPPHDHFQHHYPAQHPQHQSSFHSNQHQNYGTNRRPSPPNRGYSEASRPWSNSPVSSPFRRGSNNSPLSSYTWSSDSAKGHVSGSNNFGGFAEEDDHRYEDTFYTRSDRKL